MRKYCRRLPFSSVFLSFFHSHVFSIGRPRLIFLLAFLQDLSSFNGRASKATAERGCTLYLLSLIFFFFGEFRRFLSELRRKWLVRHSIIPYNSLLFISPVSLIVTLSRFILHFAIIFAKWIYVGI